MSELVPVDHIENKIFQIRGKRVMLDRNLAILYEVETRILIQAVKRHLKRFPEDFMFQLTKEEVVNLRSQFVISSWGGARYLPYAFTQEGVAMLSSALNSERAILVNIQIMRAFVKLREILSTHKELVHKLGELEGKVDKHDTEILMIFDAIRQLMTPPPEPTPEQPKRRIGFHP